MATLSSYPRNRGGSVVLRLLPAEIKAVDLVKKEDFFQNHVFRIQGTIDPFRVEIIPVEHGVQFRNAGAGRLAVNLRPGSIELLEEGDDIVWEGLTVMVAEGRVFVVESVNTRTRLSRTRARTKRGRGATRSAVDLPPITPHPPFAPPEKPTVTPPPSPTGSTPREFANPVDPRITQPRPLRSTYLRDRKSRPAPPPLPVQRPAPAASQSDLKRLLAAMNNLLTSYGVKLVDVEIKDGRIGRIKVRRPKQDGIK